MPRVKRSRQIASFILIMIYSVGIAHGAIPHSHYAETIEHAELSDISECSKQTDKGLISLLISLLSESEVTDIADFFVAGASYNTSLFTEANLAFVAVTICFLTVDLKVTELETFKYNSQVQLPYYGSLICSCSRRGPPTVS